MPAFPVLKTGAVMQYPSSRRIAYSTRVMRFLNGDEQRYREQSVPGKKWVIRLELLDEGELANIEAFFGSMQGQTGSFEFTDPADDTVYPDCSFEEASLEMRSVGVHQGRTSLIVRASEA
jgi:hypothetical protein